MSGIDIEGTDTEWIDTIKIHTLDSIVEGNNISAPTVDGDANIPLRQLTNRTARLKTMLDLFGIYPDITDFKHSGQNVIYNAPIRGDVVTGNLVSFYLSQYWQLDLTQTDSRSVCVGIADIENTRVITGGLITITGFGVLGYTEGDDIFANLTILGAIQNTWSKVRIGQYIFGDVIRVSIGNSLEQSIVTHMNTPDIHVTSSQKTSWGGKNLIINGDKRINQRGGDPERVLTDGEYGYDRWRGSNAGADIEQIIRQENIISGQYTISWIGGGTSTVNGTAGLSSGTSISITVSDNISVIVPKAATNIQLEPGIIQTTFEKLLIEQQLTICQYYYWKMPDIIKFDKRSGLMRHTIFFPCQMRIIPTISNILMTFDEEFGGAEFTPLVETISRTTVCINESTAVFGWIDLISLEVNADF